MAYLKLKRAHLLSALEIIEIPGPIDPVADAIIELMQERMAEAEYQNYCIKALIDGDESCLLRLWQ